MPEQPTTDRLVFEINRTPGGALQLQIAQIDEDGLGFGHRLAGPKYVGDSDTVLTAAISEADANQIRSYLNHKFPPKLTVAEHDRAWHAIEGASGEPDADPCTVLAAVLRALRIEAPTAEDEQAAILAKRTTR